MRSRAIFFSICLLAGSALRADVTARYSTTMQLAPVLPGMDQALKNASSAIPASTVVRIKGMKEYAKYGRMESIIDFETKELTLFDSTSKTYATARMDDAMAKMSGAVPAIPAGAAGPLQSLKARFEAKKTGRTETILGIQAEETEGVLTLEGPVLPGNPSSGPTMTMSLRIWQAQSTEVLRVPALRELLGYTQYSETLFNTSATIEKFMRMLPGMGDQMQAMFQQMRGNGAVPVRTEIEIRLPILAVLAQQSAKNGKPLAAGFDPNAPFLQMKQELVELSSAPVDDAVFQVPEGFQPAPLDELVKTAMTPTAQQ